jgi:zinc finger SWIM domain-containing protein 3
MEFSSRYQYLCPIYVKLVAGASECEESYRVLEQCSVELLKKVLILQKQTSIDASAAKSNVQDAQIYSSVNTTDNEQEQVMDHLNGTREKIPKKKGHKGKNHIKTGIKKSLQSKKILQPEQPPIQFAVLDAPTQPGNSI